MRTPLSGCFQAKVEKLGIDLDGKLETMQRVAVTEAEHEAMKAEVASKEKEVEDLRKKVETKDEAWLDLKVSNTSNANRATRSFDHGICMKRSIQSEMRQCAYPHLSCVVPLCASTVRTLTSLRQLNDTTSSRSKPEFV